MRVTYEPIYVPSVLAEPLRWFGSHLAIYVAGALAAGLLFAIGGAVYVRVVPPPPKILAPAIPITAPVPRVVPGGPSEAPCCAPGGVRGDLMVQLPASEIIGLKIYGSNKEPVGQVTELVLNYKGQAEGLVIGLEGGSWRSKKYVLLPYSEASFQNKNGSLESVTVPYTLGQLQKLPMSSFPMLQKNYDGKLEAASPTSGPGMDPAGPGMERKK